MTSGSSSRNTDWSGGDFGRANAIASLRAAFASIGDAVGVEHLLAFDRSELPVVRETAAPALASSQKSAISMHMPMTRHEDANGDEDEGNLMTWLGAAAMDGASRMVAADAVAVAADTGHNGNANLTLARASDRASNRVWHRASDRARQEVSTASACEGEELLNDRWGRDEGNISGSGSGSGIGIGIGSTASASACAKYQTAVSGLDEVEHEDTESGPGLAGQSMLSMVSESGGEGEHGTEGGRGVWRDLAKAEKQGEVRGTLHVGVNTMAWGAAG